MKFEVSWDEELEGYIVTVDTHPDLSWIENNPHQALSGLVLVLETEGCVV